MENLSIEHWKDSSRSSASSGENEEEEGPVEYAPRPWYSLRSGKPGGEKDYLFGFLSKPSGGLGPRLDRKGVVFLRKLRKTMGHLEPIKKVNLLI